MSEPPPPYPGNVPDAAYPPPPAGYAPPPTAPPPGGPAYPPQDPKMAGGPPPPGYGPPPPGAYPTGAPPPGGYGPPPGAPMQPGYGQPAQPGYSQPAVVVTQPMVTTTVVQQFRESPVQTICPHCQAQIVTATNYETGTFTWLICGVVCLVGCDLGCCLIPFCMDGCKDVIHSCPNCRQQISRWSRL